MFAALLLAAVVPASPVPKDAKPAGPAPRVVEFVPDSDGKVRLPAVRTETRKVQEAVAVPKQVQVNGQVENRVEVVTKEREVPVTLSVKVELHELKNLTVYTADGKEADKALALKKLAEGGVAVVSADGQKVDPKYLKLFRDDTLVLVSPELASGQTGIVPVAFAPPPVWNPQVAVPALKLIPLPPPAPPMNENGGGPAPAPPPPAPLPPPAGTQKVPGNPG